MKLIDILKANGLDDEAAQKVLDAMKEGKIFTASEENLDTRYGKLKGDFEAKDGELTEATKLIAELKKATEGSEEAQGKIKEYEEKIATLEAELVETRTDAALNQALRDGGADPDAIEFLTFKVKAKGEVKLTDEGKIYKIDDTLKELKIECPTQFANDGEGDKQGKKYDPKTLKGEGESGAGDAPSKEKFEKMNFSDRYKLAQENPEAYGALTGGNTE